MSTRTEFFRETFLAALGIGAAIVLFVALGLWLSGAFSWLWFARLVLAAALVVALVELLVVLQTLRGRTIRSGVSGVRRVDRTQGCTVALLIGMVVIGLLGCGGVMDWLVEFH